jgi:hypothetical protein
LLLRGRGHALSLHPVFTLSDNFASVLGEPKKWGRDVSAPGPVAPRATNSRRDSSVSA